MNAYEFEIYCIYNAKFQLIYYDKTCSIGLLDKYLHGYRFKSEPTQEVSKVSNKAPRLLSFYPRPASAFSLARVTSSSPNLGHQ